MNNVTSICELLKAQKIEQHDKQTNKLVLEVFNKVLSDIYCRFLLLLIRFKYSIPDVVAASVVVISVNPSSLAIS